MREFSEPRSGSFSPRIRASDVVTSFTPAALDKLCEVVDGAKVTFLGTPVFSHGDRVIVSFPGAHGRAWNRLMQGAGGWKTSCVFLPDKSTPGYGAHATSYFNRKVENSCFCDMLYGETVDWGCRWFQMSPGKQCKCFDSLIHCTTVQICNAIPKQRCTMLDCWTCNVYSLFQV